MGLPLSEETAGRDQETGSLAERQLRQKVREGGLVGSGGEQAFPFDDSLCRQDPGQSRRLLHSNPPRPRAADDQGDETHLAAGTVGRSASARELWKTAVEKEVNRARQHGLRGKVFLDIFAGAKGIAKALRALGCGCVTLELSDETWQDVTHSALQQQVLSFICRGLCAGIWLATPCATWSTARWGQPGSLGGPLRSAASPWGHPAALARSLDREKIELGNRTAKFTLKIIKAAIKHQTPVAVENPVASRLWQVLHDEGLFQVGTSMVTDMCQHGSVHRKRTRVVAWKAQTSEDLCKRCEGTRGLCSASERPHVVLQGRSTAGEPLTKAASVYPASFSRAGAGLLYSSSEEQDLAWLHSEIINGSNSGRQHVP